MNRRLLTALTLALVAAVTAFALPSFSGATFTSSSRSNATVTAAADWTPPTVSLQNPGSTVSGTVTLTAVAADAETGVKDVVLQYRAQGTTSWTTICTDASSPYSCTWATAGLADGTYTLRAIATDNAGYQTTSATVSTTVTNQLLVVLANPGDALRGTVTASATVVNAPLGLVTSLRIEYVASGSTNWRTLCSNLLTASVSCTWNTTGFANGEYDLRAVAVVGTTTHVSAIVPEVMVDNAAPSVTLANLGTPLRGVVTLAATASDLHSGVAQVVLQYAVAGTSTWRDACTVDEEPYSCRFDTTTLVSGTTYGFRAVATDEAGNVATSGVTNRLVDNTVSTVSVEDPGAFLSGSVIIAANANSTAGVTSVRVQRAPAGTTGWTDLCTDTTAPYSCAWDTRTVPDGLYSLRAVMVDALGNVTTSATVANRRVDNSPLRGYDVQTVSGGVAGRLDADDELVLTYSQEVNPATVTAGWNGSPLAVTLRLRDGNSLGLGPRGDTLDVLRNGSPINLGSVNLREDYIKNKKSATFAATMTATTTVIDGIPRTVIRVEVGAQTSGQTPRGGSAAGAMVWTPSGAVRGLTGLACSAAPVTETGPADREW